ncbi:hypothetical protein K449DRAFT_388868 [Hypoxylon sp. EC38]|nr:hypothetical protein K449DRAFT_388868 [Hypoxylon sp. EC38]
MFEHDTMEQQNHMSLPPPTHDQKHGLQQSDPRHVSPSSDPTAGFPIPQRLSSLP